jgi:hypothetical protein
MCQTVTLSRVLKVMHLRGKRRAGNCGEVQVFEQLPKPVKKFERGDRKLELSRAGVCRCNARGKAPIWRAGTCNQ